MFCNIYFWNTPLFYFWASENDSDQIEKGKFSLQDLQLKMTGGFVLMSHKK